MAFILAKDRPENSYEEWRSSWIAYCNYLQSIKDHLPIAAYEFATATWHFNPESNRDPHDSWLESVTILEPSSGNRSQYRSIDIIIRLLGPYHDGHIEINYSKVQSYSMDVTFDSQQERQGHGDWLYDEIRLSERGYMLHEIEWSRGSYWFIECIDFTYKWLPFENNQAEKE